MADALGCVCKVPLGPARIYSKKGRLLREVRWWKDETRWKDRLALKGAAKLGLQIVMQDRCVRCHRLPSHPHGLKCGDCVYMAHCAEFVQAKPDNTACDWFPTRFRRRHDYELVAPDGKREIIASDKSAQHTVYTGTFSLEEGASLDETVSLSTCTVRLNETCEHGFTFRRATAETPFKATMSSMLRDVFAQSDAKPKLRRAFVYGTNQREPLMDELVALAILGLDDGLSEGNARIYYVTEKGLDVYRAWLSWRDHDKVTFEQYIKDRLYERGA